MARSRKQNLPIKRVVLTDGRERWRLVVDAGTDPKTGKRRQVTSTHDTEREAKDAYAKHRASLLAGNYVGKTNTTVAQHFDDWLASRRKARANTIAGYRSMLRPLYEWYGDVPVQKFTSDKIVTLRDRLATEGGRGGKGRAPRSVNLVLMLVEAAMEQAVTAGLVPYNPATKQRVERLTSHDADDADNPIGQAWTLEQMQAYLAEVTGDRYEAAWRLTFCGLRRSEVLGLTWSDVDFDAGTITVRQGRTARLLADVGDSPTIVAKPKSKRSRRTIHVPADTIAALRAFRAVQREDRLRHGLGRLTDASFVVVDEGGFAISPDYYSDLFQQHAARAGLPRIRLHDARHSVATWLNAAGMPVAAAAAFLGHDPAMHLRVYAHGQGESERVADVLGTGLAGGRR